MFELLIAALATAAQEPPPLLTRDPLPGATAAENRTMSQSHPNATARTFPDLAVKELKIDGDTLYVLVRNEGEVGAKGPIRVVAKAEAGTARIASSPATIRSLKPGEDRWVALSRFRSRGGESFAIAGATRIAAAVTPAGQLPKLIDRTGRGCDACVDGDDANNMLAAEGSAIARGKPE